MEGEEEEEDRRRHGGKMQNLHRRAKGMGLKK